ncbi:pteridine reductase [Panacagrimonas sp.]|uniref:pteridine reductase n=1 Tax=Panacagrimonas sp. TaxID=2480088 RepID=UPI003B52D01D
MIRNSPSPSAAPVQPRVVLVTGAGRRIGAAIARRLHARGDRVVLHCRHSRQDAEALAAALNAQCADSACVLPADLLDLDALRSLATLAHACWGRLDALVNNASSYYATPLGELSAAQFDDLIGSNLRAPLFLAQACAPLLADGGSIVNIIDVHARRPMAGFSAYLCAKSALWTLTEALALELAPRLRVNGIAPGHMLWADQPQFSPDTLAREQQRIPLARLGGGDEVAHAVCYLLSDQAHYLTGAVIPVDGGLHLA